MLVGLIGTASKYGPNTRYTGPTRPPTAVEEKVLMPTHLSREEVQAAVMAFLDQFIEKGAAPDVIFGA
jgi:hypothetical protein